MIQERGVYRSQLDGLICEYCVEIAHIQWMILKRKKNYVYVPGHKSSRNLTNYFHNLDLAAIQKFLNLLNDDLGLDTK